METRPKGIPKYSLTRLESAGFDRPLKTFIFLMASCLWLLKLDFQI